MNLIEMQVENTILQFWDKKTEFKRIVKGKDVERIKAMCLDLHKDTHFADKGEKNICDFLFEDFSNEVFSAMPVKKHMTIAWCFWHLYRIEDIVSNLLIAHKDQIFNQKWASCINAGITDTGNALSYFEAVQLSKRINLQALKDYCIAVQKNTVKIVRSLQIDDISRKPTTKAFQ